MLDYQITFITEDCDNSWTEFRYRSDNSIWQFYCSGILFKIFIKFNTHENI